MYDLNKDWAVLNAAVPDLEGYLLSSELFLPLNAKKNISGMVSDERLSLGTVLLSQARLNASDFSVRKADELEVLNDSMKSLRMQWLSIWQRKAALEFPARLTMWQNYLEEAVDDRDRFKTYSYHVRWRAMLYLLAQEKGSHPLGPAEERLSVLDLRLKAVTRPADFTWDKELASGFPEAIFWFLYRKPA